MKAIIENNDTWKVNSEKGDFFVTENNRGKLKMFAKRDVVVVEISEMPQVKVYRKSTYKPTEAQHAAFLNKIREAEFQDKYFEVQRNEKF